MICDNCDERFSEFDVKRDFFDGKIIIICPYCKHGNYLGTSQTVHLGNKEEKP